MPVRRRATIATIAALAVLGVTAATPAGPSPTALTMPARGTVYLTFDDGPSPHTAGVLRVLTARHATATFFQLGVQQRRFPAAADQVRRQGSRIGNHTYDHRDLTTLTAAGIRSELGRGPAAVCVRPPYGATNTLVRRIIAARHQRQVLWSIDTQDWSRPGTGTIRARALAGVRAGSIVLLHDGGGDRSQTLAALPSILDELGARGYTVAALPYC